jgi:hypothetical protein
MRLLNGMLFGGMSLAAFASSAWSADLPARSAPPAPPPPVVGSVPALGFLSEARIGAMAHDPWSPEHDGAVDLNLELLTVKPFHTSDPSWDWLVPRFNVGGTIDFQGYTSTAYAGLAWTYDITPALFVEATFGGAIHNGELDPRPGSDMNALGCRGLFRESASLGWRFTRNWSVMATVEHYSNAGLCDNNRGLTNAGVRVGYTF